MIIRPKEIAVTNLEDREDARNVVESLVKTINGAWERRAGIQPDFRKRERLKHTDVYRLLPGTNCKGCGVASCFVFALKVTAGEAEIDLCKPLLGDEYRSNREKLTKLIEGAPFGK